MFESSKFKVERAEKHILELYNFMQSFTAAPDLYSVSIEADCRYRDLEIVITIHKSKDEFRNEAALIIGDVYHNLRSALDILWFEIVSSTGLQTKWTRFPIADTRQELTRPLGAALEKGQITKTLHDFVLDTIKPYREGNFRIWAVNEMNIIDKHQLLIPNFPMIAIEGVRIQNDENIIFELPVLFTDSSFRRRLSQINRSVSFGRSPKVSDKGHAAIGYGFDLGNPHQGDPVIPTLNAVTKEVTGAIETFSFCPLPAACRSII
ncbi:MAG TPA: hypothetical protein VK709_12310 [Candidatus Saccharimonadales bacterium]|nr:hypothetical protein [Candidatus Saccharimonadales bacterium]